jgi:integrase
MAVIDERKGRNGETVYRVRIRVKGRPMETQTFSRRRDAKDWAQAREHSLKAEVTFGAAAHAKKPLSELIDRYFELELPKRHTDQRRMRTRLTWWRDQIGDVALKDMTPALLAECRDRLLAEAHKHYRYSPKSGVGRQKSPATVVGYMMALSHAFTVASKEWGWLTSNPMSNVKKPALPQGRVRFLDDDERDRLLKACESSDCDVLLPIVVLAISTGARYSEIMNLRWTDIDLERGLARLEKTKNGERRALPLTHKALQLIRDLRERCDSKARGLLFPRADGMAPMAIQKHWKSAIERAGIQDFRFHDLRHSAASYLAMNGATLAEIAEVLGHRTLQMVKRYAHISDQHTASVVERMNRKIFAANDNEEEVLQKTRKRK